MANNKIIFGDQVLIDLTADTVSADKLLRGFTAHDKSGEIIEGLCDFDVDSSDADAAVAEILINKTAYARGVKLKGTMPNNGAVTGSIASKDQDYIIPMGFHDGSGKVSIDATEKAKLIASNIKQGVTILGVDGGYTGAAITSQNKSVTPTKTEQIIQPDETYDYLSQVTVAPIPYTETPNSAGGTTVTIAGV